ncbi:MAG TPA: DMT family transporter [Euzebya sp.]|nr:DMT family transporter [Euzebya sp.]
MTDAAADTGDGGLAGPLTRPATVRVLMLVGMVAVSFAAILIRTAAAPALALAFWRALGGAVVLGPFAARAEVRPDPAQRRAMVASGVCLAVHFALFIGAFSYTSVASAVVFTTTAPLFVGLASWLLLHQPPTRRTWAGIAVAVAGAGIVALADTGAGASGSNPLLGDAMALASAVAVSGYLILGQRVRTRLAVTTYGTWVYGSAALVLAGAALLVGSPLGGFDTVTWLVILGLIIGPQLLGHTMFNQVMGVVPATTVAVVVLSEPVGAGLLAFLLLDEVPPPLLAVGGPLILLGAFLAATGGRMAGPLEPTAG